MSKICMCDNCLLDRRYRAALLAKDFDSLAAVTMDALNALCDAQAEAEYYSVIADGSWPSAVERLEKWLAAAKEQRRIGQAVTTRPAEAPK